MNSARFLVGTLYSGENELEACKRSVQQQRGVLVEHKIFEYLPNQRAHEVLYSEFMRRHAEFDVFVKLDADMVLRHPMALQAIQGVFAEDASVDHAEFAVHDWYSNQLLMGMHAFSPRATWTKSSESLFVDPAPLVPGKRVVFWNEPSPLADHCPDPSPFQAFHFGVHRAVKAIQPDRRHVRHEDCERQWRLLKAVWHHFCEVRERRLGMAVLGAQMTMTGHTSAYDIDYTNASLRELFDARIAILDAEEIYARVAPVWGNSIRREIAHKSAVGISRYVASVMRRIGQRRWNTRANNIEWK